MTNLSTASASQALSLPGGLLVLAFLFSGLLARAPSAWAAEVYSNSFNGPPGTAYLEWSSSTIAYASNAKPPGSGTLPAPAVTNTVSPNQRQRFLGEFAGPAIGNQATPATTTPAWTRPSACR